MSVSHHGSNEKNDEDLKRLLKRFNDQCDGIIKREYSQGRLGANDDGDLAYAIATDQRNRTIVIRFGKPTEWIGLSIEDAKQLVDQLTTRIVNLQTGGVV